jgi:hypothetical protein
MMLSTTESSVDGIDQPTTKDETVTVMTPTATEEKCTCVVPDQFSEAKLALILSAISLGISIILTLAMLLMSCKCKKNKKKSKPKKGEIPKMNEFTMHINPARTFHTYTSPIYNPYFSEEKDDSYAL